MDNAENQPTQFVIVQERSSGNESVGDMWLDTHTFPPTATLAEVWATIAPSGTAHGRTMIRPNESAPRTPFRDLFSASRRD